MNLCGAGALGLLVGGGMDMMAAGTLAQVLATGFLGGFTTFSTWMVESVRLTAEAGRTGMRAGLANLAGMAAAGVTAAGAGMWLAG